MGLVAVERGDDRLLGRGDIISTAGVLRCCCFNNLLGATVVAS